MIAFVLLAVGGGILYPTIRHWNDEDPTAGAIVGGGFALVGLIMAYTAIHQSMAIRTPETEVAIDEWPLKPGQSAKVRIRQPGPVKLRSMSGRLICEVRERRLVRRRNQPDTYEWNSKYPCQDRFFHSDPTSVPEGGHFETTADLCIPADAVPSGSKGEDLTVQWRIEVWGRVRWWPDFMHPYEISVV